MADKSMEVQEKGEEREIELWDPFREFRTSSWLSPLGGLFEDFLTPLRTALPALPKAWMPRVDIQETEKEYLFSVALPGVRKEDVKVEVKNDILTLSGERKAEREEKGKNWLRRETSYGSFQRSFVLPENIHPENVKATCKDGVLSVSLRKPPEAKSRGALVKID